MIARVKQLDLFVSPPLQVKGDRPTVDHSTTFIPNQELPIHRWFRYSAGFSAAWAGAEIAKYCCPGRSLVFDPFVGCGTTLIAAQHLGVASVGIEAHRFVLRIARAKLRWTSDVRAFESLACHVLQHARRRRSNDLPDVPSLISRIYDDDTLRKLLAIAAAISHAAPPKPDSPQELAWLALVAILRACSHANTAPWQYVLPRKRKTRVLEPFEAYGEQVALMAHDMRVCQLSAPTRGTAAALLGDARSCDGVADHAVDLVLTSPPYPNNYDYADATRVEMSFLGDVARWADLHYAVRRHLIPSCSQHGSKENLNLDELLRDSALDPIRSDLAATCCALADLRRRRAGKKTYDTMLAAYFAGMSCSWRALSRVVRPGGLVCFVVGDSAPYGVHVPVERWLGALAEAAHFEVLRFEETRKRNVKWKNRKHRVPLHEGRLWLRRS
jgi:DNA modification methylase